MLLTLLLPLVALAAAPDAEERLQQKRQAILRDYLKNDHTPPTCASLEAYPLPPEPPAQCIQVKEYWRLLSELRAGNLKTCHGEDATLEEVRSDARNCQKDVYARIEAMDRVSEATDEAVLRLNSSETVRKLEESLDDGPSGELADTACRRSELALFQFRYKHARIAEGHASEVSDVIDHLCGFR